jgi:D-alanyl-D-alanine carboxypeptidase
VRRVLLATVALLGAVCAAAGAARPAAAGPVTGGWAVRLAVPGFHGSSAPIDAATGQRMRWSWRPGCPVPLADLRLVRADHWGFDGRVHRGELVVHQQAAADVLWVLARLYRERFPIQRMRLVDAYRGSDDRSMAANNTSGFNCRRVAGSASWSEHAYGRAIDLNPLRNPYVAGGHVSPPAGRPYADRSPHAPGMVHAGDAVVRSFAAVGWRWGGSWRSAKDYQHFSSTGR